MKNVAEFGKKWYKEIRKKGVNEVIIYCCLRHPKTVGIVKNATCVCNQYSIYADDYTVPLFAGDNVYLMRKNEVIAKIDVDSIVDIKPSSGWYL